MAQRLILGSQSKFRRQLLARQGLQFECMNPDIDEKAVTGG
jgi:predicted house-cleaning NTP pyrophosphatase (Maf/HAM1 superfamily)